MDYINVQDVNTYFEVTNATEWAGTKNPGRCVKLANLWLSDKDLPILDPPPQAWKDAACEIAKEIANGNIYAKKEIGLTSKSVSADTVSSSKTFSSNYQVVSEGEQIALALLADWLDNKLINIMILKKV